MHWMTMTTETQDDDEKGRTFTVYQVLAIAPRLKKSTTPHRPFLFAYCGTSSQAKSFTANLKLGRTARCGNTRFELLRSMGYRFQELSPEPGQALVVAYLPELLHLEGPRAERRIEFVAATPSRWVEQQLATLSRRHPAKAPRALAASADFVARLNARSALPIVQDLAFHEALFEEAKAQRWVTEPRVWGDPADLGLEPPIHCDVSVDRYREFLARVTASQLPRLGHSSMSPRIDQPALTFAA